MVMKIWVIFRVFNVLCGIYKNTMAINGYKILTNNANQLKLDDHYMSIYGITYTQHKNKVHR